MNEMNQGYPIYRMNEINNMLTQNRVEKYADISKEQLKKYLLKDKDILFNRTNSLEWVGRTGIYYKNNDFDHIFASYLVKFNTIESVCTPEYLVAFLNSKFGKEQLSSRVRESINQANINPEEVKEMEIPIIDFSLQQLIADHFMTANIYRNNSEELYQEAKDLFLSKLGLNRYSPTQNNISIKSYSSSFLNSGRFDAEFYHPRYDEIFNIINQNGVDIIKLEDYVIHNLRGLQPVSSSKGVIDVINSRHILEGYLDYKNFGKTDSSYWDKNARARVYKGDVLIYTTGANIGRAATYLSNSKALASNHVNILRVHTINPLYLSLVFNSIVGRLQTEKLSAGSAQQELYPRDIAEFHIPILNKTIQKQIANKLHESFLLKMQSENLLNDAVRAVEIAVEQDEKTAIIWLKQDSGR